MFACTASLWVFSVYIKLQIFPSPPWIQEALLAFWWGRATEDWIVDQWWSVSMCSSASKMSIALSFLMHFSGRFVWKTRRDIPQNSRQSSTSLVKTVPVWPQNRVHPTTDPVEGTVEIFSLSSLKNNYCSMFSASYLRKQVKYEAVFFWCFMHSNWNLLHWLVLF